MAMTHNKQLQLTPMNSAIVFLPQVIRRVIFAAELGR